MAVLEAGFTSTAGVMTGVTAGVTSGAGTFEALGVLVLVRRAFEF